MIKTVDEFIEQKVLPEHREIVAGLRELMRKAAPEAEEVITYGILAWRVRRIIAVVSPTKRDITLAFSRGAEFEDRFGMLRGEGHVSKNVKIKSVRDINPEALRYYIRQALALEKK
jgi:hypothetical protein